MGPVYIGVEGGGTIVRGATAQCVRVISYINGRLKPASVSCSVAVSV